MEHLLVHSPLLGPGSMVQLDAAIGGAVVVPDLREVVTGPPPRVPAIVSAAVTAVESDEVVVVVHSGAGVFAPGIVTQLGARLRAVVFVDAVLPERSGVHVHEPRLLGLLDEQTVDGELRPWLDWWDADIVERLLPNRAVRARLAADQPRVPRDLYDEPVPLPATWSDVPAGYVMLSEPYAEAAEEAGRRGWPTVELASNHLAPITDPESVALEVGRLVRRLRPGDRA